MTAPSTNPLPPTDDPIIAAVAARIDRFFAATNPGDQGAQEQDITDEALVISLYGEWGVGKTRVLKALNQHFTQQLANKSGTAPLIVPVFFSAWRFEKEPHLIVPLIKTVELALQSLVKAPTSGLGKQPLAVIKAAAQGLGGVAYALAHGLSFNFGVVGFSGKDALEGADKASKKIAQSQADMPAALPANWQSIYYDTTRHLEQLCQKQPSNGHAADAKPLALQFLVLIDDLDRCLPEKAVAMLEAIKLFLDIRAFAFVLGVDNEVVERGIAHRYKDYLSLTSRATTGGMNEAAVQARSNDVSLPITGAEYLEKMIHLPVVLPRQNSDSALQLVLRYESELTELLAKIGPWQDAQLTASDLLAQLVALTPPVPRKLIRAAEGLLFQLSLLLRLRPADDAGTAFNVRAKENLPATLFAQINPALVLRIVLLQQLYPDIYRLIKRHPLLLERLHQLQENANGILVYCKDKNEFTQQQIESLIDKSQAAVDEARGQSPTQAEAKPKTGTAVDADSIAASNPVDPTISDSALVLARPHQNYSIHLDGQKLTNLRDLMRVMQQALHQRGANTPLALFRADQDSLGWDAGTPSHYLHPLYQPWPAVKAPPDQTAPTALQPLAEKMLAMQAAGQTALKRSQSSVEASLAQALAVQLRDVWTELDTEIFDNFLKNFDWSVLTESVADALARQFAPPAAYAPDDPIDQAYRPWLEQIDYWYLWERALEEKQPMAFARWRATQDELRATAKMAWSLNANQRKIYSPRFRLLSPDQLATIPVLPVGKGDELEGYEFLGVNSLVQDLRTGLIWQRYAVGQGWSETQCRPQEKEGIRKNWDRWRSEMETVTTTTGWRMPDKDELSALVEDAGQNLKVKRATIDAAAFPDCPRRFFWSASPDVGDSYRAWGVYFYDGNVDGNGRSYHGHVRLVRASQ